MTPATKTTATRIYETALTRANGTCECCGERAGTQIHARHTNAHTEHALLLTCDDCANLARTPLGITLGWTVLEGNDPEMVPYFRRSDSTWRTNGIPVIAQAAVEYLQLCGQMKTGLEWAY